MIFTVLAYIIVIACILAYFVFQIFPLYGLLGPRMGASKKMIDRWRLARRGHKWEHEGFGKHSKRYDFDFWMCDWR